MIVYLIRHALADYNTQLAYHLLPGPALTEEGVDQAGAVARLLEGAGITRVLSSPMQRCVMTAGPLCARLGLQLALDDDLGEMRQGETMAALGLRMLRSVLSQADASPVALVSHSAPLEQLMLALTHGEIVLPPPGDRGARVRPGEVWQLLLRDGRWRVHHLPPGGAPA